MFTKGFTASGAQITTQASLATFDIQYIGTIPEEENDTSWQEFTFTNISSHVNKNARLMILFQSSGSPSADLALDSIQLGTTVWDFDSGINGFQQPTVGDGSRYGSPTNASGVFTEYNTKTFTDLANTGTAREFFNRRSGSTPSSDTGPSGAYSGSYYLYAETSGNGRRNDFYLRSPLITVASNYVRVYAYRKADIREGSSTYDEPVGPSYLYLIYQTN